MATYNYTPTSFVQMWERPADPRLAQSGIPSGQRIFVLEEQTFTSAAGGDEVDIAMGFDESWVYRPRYGQVTIGNTTAAEADLINDPYEQLRWAPPAMPSEFSPGILMDLQMETHAKAQYGATGAPGYGIRKSLNIGFGTAPYFMTWRSVLPDVILTGQTSLNVECETDSASGTVAVSCLYVFDMYTIEQGRYFSANLAR